MSGGRGQTSERVPYHSGWEAQLRKRVLYRGRVARVAHADLFRLVLLTEDDPPQRIAVEESDWPEVQVLEPGNGDAAEGEGG